MRSLEVVAALIWERVPLGYDTRQSGEESKRLAREFVAEHRLGEVVEVEALELLTVQVVRWVRDLGYDLLDEPPGPCLTSGVPRDLSEWLPASDARAL